jgi:putative Flp pilus-assembly TadE/G-like protein
MIHKKRDGGSVSIMFAIGMIAVIMFIGLAVDGGAQIRGTQLASQMAAEAARAGGQAIDIRQAIAGNATTIQTTDPNNPTDPTKAPYKVAAENYLTNAATEAGVTIVSGSENIYLVNSRTISVTVTIRTQTTILALFGQASSLDSTGSAVAVLEINP